MPPPLERPQGSPARRLRPLFGVGIPLLIGFVHIALIAPHYFVGSFDDDASYILTAKALLAGEGLNGHLTSGVTISGLYAPGYSALLAPLVWLWPHTFVPLRLFSVACYSGIFVLTWIYLGRRGINDGLRTATLVLLALDPPLATYANMVMAETPFLVVLLVLLLLVGNWDVEERTWTWNAVGVVVSAAALVWLKQAGIGVVAGVVLWVALRRGGRRLGRVLVVAGGVLVLLLPVIVARLVAGIPLAGALYSDELGTYYKGGLVHRLLDVVPHSGWHLLATAIPATLVPYLQPLPLTRHWSDFWIVLSWQVTLLVAVGGVVWFRRHRDVAVAIVPVYLAETVLWPYVNERRAILVLPLLTAWYVVGAVAAWQAVASWSRRRVWLSAARAGAGVFVVGAVVVPLVAQVPRDYLFGWHKSGSHFEGSRYALMLEHLGRPADVVESDYMSSTALFTGHRTNNSAFIVTLSDCDANAAMRALASDDAGFLLLGDLNKPGLMDSPCLLRLASSSPWAVPLLHTGRDDASVYELIGPGTGHPGLANIGAHMSPTTTTTTSGASATVEWDWPEPAQVEQVSVGEAGLSGAPTASVELELRQPDGSWVVVASAPGAVGDGRGAAPYLLAEWPDGMTASGLRVVVTGTSPGGMARVQDVAALGPAPSG